VIWTFGLNQVMKMSLSKIKKPQAEKKDLGDIVSLQKDKK